MQTRGTAITKPIPDPKIDYDTNLYSTNPSSQPQKAVL